MKKILLFQSIFFCQPVFCQNTADTARIKAIDTYNNIVNIQSGLYNGVEYSGYLPGFEGHQYYNSSDWLKGSVFYDGMLHTEVSLKYDMLTEKLIVKRYDGFAIELLDEKLNYFTVGTDVFKQFFVNQALPPGYYQELYVGNVSIYAKKIKVKQDNRNENSADQSLEEKETKYYAIRGEEVVIINNLNSISKLMDDTQRKGHQYLKQNNISFKKNQDAAIIKIAEYYNQVNRN